MWFILIKSAKYGWSNQIKPFYIKNSTILPFFKSLWLIFPEQKKIDFFPKVLLMTFIESLFHMYSAYTSLNSSVPDKIQFSQTVSILSGRKDT